jgi:2-pyrone-4,6-dicarboxylate lactonase
MPRMTTSLPAGRLQRPLPRVRAPRPLSLRGRRTLHPAQDAPREALYAVNDRLGLQRCVIVQSTCHGLDNSVTEHAIAGRPRDYRGIALVRTDVADAELARLDARRLSRGALQLTWVIWAPSAPGGRGAGAGPAHGAARLAPAGSWRHRVVDRRGAGLARSSPVPVVIDHIGRVDAGLGLQQPAFDALRSLLDSPTFWVKVSGVDRITRLGPPYDDALPFARSWLQRLRRPCRLGQRLAPSQPCGASADRRTTRGPDHSAWRRRRCRVQRLMVDNPQRLYRFDDTTLR